MPVVLIWDTNKRFLIWIDYWKKMIELNSSMLTTLLLFSFRYAVDRTTGISHEICDLISKFKSDIDPWALDQIKRDLKRKIDVGVFQLDYDKENWSRLLDKL